MDSSRILVALQELEKWRERRDRIRARLRQIQARRRYLEKELSVVRGRAARLEEMVSAAQYPTTPRQVPFVTFQNIR